MGIYEKSTNHWRTAPPRHAFFPPAGKSRLNHNSVICWFTLTIQISYPWNTSIISISSSQNCVLLHCFHFPSKKHPTKIIQHHINNQEFSLVFSVASNCSSSETCSKNQEPPRSICLQLTKVNQLIIFGAFTGSRQITEELHLLDTLSFLLQGNPGLITTTLFVNSLWLYKLATNEKLPSSQSHPVKTVFYCTVSIFLRRSIHQNHPTPHQQPRVFDSF